MENTMTIRYSEDATICVTDDGDGTFSVPTQDEMDTLPVGDDLTPEEIDGMES